MLSLAEIEESLQLRGRAQEELFAAARRSRESVFGAEVVLRGVVEVTNVCRVDCDYCPMRRSNTATNDRYLLTPEQIVACTDAVRAAGIDIVLLQGGETPQAVRSVSGAIPTIRASFDDNVEILLNLGSFSRRVYSDLRDLGATSYILKHETAEAELHERIRHESLEKRLQCLQDLVDLGYRVGTGIISGLPGQDFRSIAREILLIGTLGVHMWSVSPLVPARNTPLHGLPSGDLDTALNAIAVARICYPHLLIPSVSALEKAGGRGQSRGLAAGANVLTINFTSALDRSRYLIYGDERFVVTRRHVEQILDESGLTARGSVFINDRRGERAGTASERAQRAIGDSERAGAASHRGQRASGHCE